MNEIQVFNNTEFGEIRTVEIDNEVWFVGKDVAAALGYERDTKAVTDHVDEEDCKYIDGKTQSHFGFELGQRGGWLINESGVYALVFNSKLPKAKEFKKWVTHDVLPSIRKHGAYMTEQTLEQALTSPDFLIKLATQLKEEKDKNKVLKAENAQLTVDKQIMQPKAEYFDELVDRNLLTSFRDTAKLLEVKERDFVKFLIEKKYIYRDKKGKLMPHADKNTGLFEIKETFNEKTKWSGTQTLITPKGRETFRLLYLKYTA